MGELVFALAREQRAFLAVAHCPDATFLDAELDQVVPGGDRAAFGQGEVVLVGAPIIGVAFDKYASGRVALQVTAVVLHARDLVGADARLVEIKVDRSHFR